MTDREKFLGVARFELTDVLCLPKYWQWFWEETFTRWHKEGLPEDVHRSQYFGFERTEAVPVNIDPLPRSEQKILEQTAEWRIVIDSIGRKRREIIDGGETYMPQWLEFPIKDRRSWQEFKKKLNPSSPTRYPEYFEDWKRCIKNRDYPLLINLGGFYSRIRGWVGMENLAYMFYDDPNLVHEIMEYIEYFIIEILRRFVEEVDLDVVHFWEDMAFKTQPLISPKMFREFMLPHYQKVTDFVRSHEIDIITMDSDGNVNELLPLWLEGGLNGIFPGEVAANNDAAEWRKKYGKNLIIMGNIDKRVLAKDKASIEKEVMKKVPYLLHQGGYFPTVDHSCPPDVPFENFTYYLSLLRKIGN